MLFEKNIPRDFRDTFAKDSMSGMLFAAMVGLTVPFFAVIARHSLKASALQIGIITMAPFAGNILALFSAHASEGRRKLPFVVWSGVLARSLFLLMLLATTSTFFVTIIAAFWLVTSLQGPAYSAVMKEVYPDSDRAKIMGYVRVGIVIVMIIMTAIAGPLLRVISYRYVFAFAAIFGIASSLVFGMIKATKRTGDQSASFGQFFRSSLLILQENPGFRWFCAGTVISGSANLLSVPIYAIYQVDVLHIDTMWASWYAIVTQLISIFAFIYWGHYIDRKSSVDVVVKTSFMLALAPLTYCFATQAWMLLPACVITGVVSAGSELAYFSGVLHYAPADRVTSYQAVFLSLTGLRGIIAPLLGATLVQSGVLPMKGIFIISAAMLVLSVYVQSKGHRKYP